MTNVSKKALKKSVEEKISNQLATLVADINRSDKSTLFIEDFFTKSEEIMFAKRLAVIFMILEDFPYLAISSVLKVSPSTVHKISKIVDRGGYQSIRRYFNDRKNKEAFHYKLEVILRAGMPPIVGKGRWAQVNKILERNRKK